MAPTRMPPASRCAPTAFSPADAMQPHCEQSGLPPNWHGVMRCSKSAETQLVVRAKMHSSGLDGGVAYCLTSPSGIPIFGKRARIAISAATTRSRSSGRQDLGRDLADLRRVEAEPELPHVRVRRPEVRELLEVAVALHLLPRHRAVHGDLLAGDVLEDPIVGGRRAAGVVLGLQAVDRDDDLQPRNRRPLGRNRPHGARHELRVDAASRRASAE